MNFLYLLLGTPLGWIMWLCYQITNNYGFALFLFTLISRAVMLPMTFKQQQSTAKMTMIQPQMKELQTKYSNNREKLSEEMNKLYQKAGYNPMSGCLPMLIPLLIMFGLIDVIYRPLKHILHLPQDIILRVEEIALNLGLVPSISGLNPSQIRAVQSISENVAPWLEIGQDNINTILSLNLNFFGMNLGLTPSMDMFKNIFTQGVFNPLLLVPVFSGVSAIILSLITMRTTAISSEAAGAAGASMKSMMLVTPIFSFMIAFNVPAGVGLYWTYSNIFAIAQSLLLNKFYNPRELAEKARREFEEQQEKERQERIEAKKQAKLRAQEPRQDSIEIDEKALSQKEYNRRKLAEARRRDAEKYGETYVEVTDDDIR